MAPPFDAQQAFPSAFGSRPVSSKRRRPQAGAIRDSRSPAPDRSPRDEEQSSSGGRLGCSSSG
jgi:hypothetical protein